MSLPTHSKTKSFVVATALCFASVAIFAACSDTPALRADAPAAEPVAKPEPPKKTTASTDTPANAFARLLLAIDARDWSGVRNAMAQDVVTDYSSLFGAPPATAPSDDIVAQWRTMLSPLDATQHLLGTVAVEEKGSEATVVASVRGYHYAHGIAAGSEWMVAGQYTAKLGKTDAGWKLTALRLDTHQQTGNRALLSQAARRVRRASSGTDGVILEPVRFTSLGERLAGHLYLPAKRKGPVQGVVVLGSWTTVKEQMASTYARKLAEKGYAALAFDTRGYGESAGEPRNTESPTGKMADVQAAARFLASHPAVAGDGVGALGICAGAGYVAGAAAGDAPITSVALVAPWLHDAEMVKAVYGGTEGVAKRMAAAKQARAQFEATGKPTYVPAASAKDERAAMFGPFDYYLNPKRGAVAAWPNQFAVMAWADWLSFDPHPHAEALAQPVVMVHSEKAALPQGAKRFFSGLKGKKEAHWIEGSQFHFYDDPATVDAAVAHVAKHLGSTL